MQLFGPFTGQGKGINTNKRAGTRAGEEFRLDQRVQHRVTRRKFEAGDPLRLCHAQAKSGIST